MQVGEYLKSKGLQAKLNSSKTDYYLNCPFCEDERERFGIRAKPKEDGFQHWNCFNCNQRGKTFDSFKTKLENKYGDKNISEINFRKKPERKVETNVNQALSKKLFKNLKKSGRKALQYLYKERGFKKETVIHFQLGSCKRKGYEYVSIPFFENNILVNVKYRAIDYKDKKYKWLRLSGGKSSLFHDERS